jgi:predicted restriction endonuclease
MSVKNGVGRTLTILSKIEHPGAAAFLREYFSNYGIQKWSGKPKPRAKVTSRQLLDDDEEPPPSVTCAVSRRIRNSAKAEELKRLYDWKCQVCRLRIAVPLDGNEWYAEVHHFRPLGGQHKGFDNWDNMLVLCPNCHACFDCLAMGINPSTGRVISFGRERATHGRRPVFLPGHELARENIKYHWSRFCEAIARKGKRR